MPHGPRAGRLRRVVCAAVVLRVVDFTDFEDLCESVDDSGVFPGRASCATPRRGPDTEIHTDAKARMAIRFIKGCRRPPGQKLTLPVSCSPLASVNNGRSPRKTAGTGDGSGGL